MSPRALAIFAHPDDAELACFGSLAALNKSGVEIHVVFLTEGSNSSSKYSHLRSKEAEKAALHVRGRLAIEELTDGDLSMRREVYATVHKHLARIEPTIVFTHYPGSREHQDHQATGNVVMTLASKAPTVTCLLLCEPVSDVGDFTPNLFTNISPYMPTKLDAIDCYQSEAEKPFMGHAEVLSRAQSWARWVSRSSTGQYFEAFVAAKLILRPSLDIFSLDAV